MIRQQLQRVLRVFFSKSAKTAATAAIKKAKELNKITEDERKKAEVIALAAYDAILWNNLVEAVREELQAVVEQAGQEGLQQLNVANETVKEAINRIAVDYATMRSAEMVGMQYEEEKLVEFPAATWNIAKTTKDDLFDLAIRALQKNSSFSTLEEDILTAKTFSLERTELIAKQETAIAQVKTNLDVWRRTGIVTKVEVFVSNRHSIIDQCDDLVDSNPYDITDVPLIPAHPRCECGIRAVEVI